ncbi:MULTISPECIES: phosphonate utilization transcriptional regulator PhnR [Photobacterium]|uniref:GntR family transcriptional regulator n=1 Tax=Photobacterium ganghwense TaxID=320778 RepID=A0A0J1K298_9GAMM|nr:MULTISPECIES: phosphonate utilization transcriptional regulator PhnR [Photobacterium]KLV08552.1 GntR family transcriptional regulator [Photobacterium ganghwense]MBV1839125.1 phosphonate utilization transcriptional regulator PhnR [Photobacterium ganghwense]PSU10663.1 phosphonate utilization transcriptional regulator PhnR [Photobacterium ganghwense]QSV12806.1 phosphonate utilization transcriptional regulator PhnR [Photobacterium ganghwense]
MQYLKIMEAINEQIDAGLLVAGNKLPAERKLAESFNTTRVTLRESLALLEAEGKLYREDRRGWFVSPQPLRYDPTYTTNFPEMARQQGRTARSELIQARLIPASRRAASLLKVPPLSEVYRIDRVRFLENRPVVVVTNFILPRFFPGLLERSFTHSLTTIYREEYGVLYSKTRYRVRTTSLLGDTAQHLRATAGSPAMLVERLNYDQHGNVIDCDLEYWRHDAISIESTATLD